MLRSDMDALPIQEETGLPFASCNAGKMHACGHDLHTAILLGAAKLLKERESELRGPVKLLFQPGEEIFAGGKACVEEGVLENPSGLRHARLAAGPHRHHRHRHRSHVLGVRL